MNDGSAERQPLINSNAADGRRPPVYSSHQFPVDEGCIQSTMLMRKSSKRSLIRNSITGEATVSANYSSEVVGCGGGVWGRG